MSRTPGQVYQEPIALQNPLDEAKCTLSARSACDDDDEMSMGRYAEFAAANVMQNIKLVSDTALAENLHAF